jgi:hypothetical protein
MCAGHAKATLLFSKRRNIRLFKKPDGAGVEPDSAVDGFDGSNDWKFARLTCVSLLLRNQNLRLPAAAEGDRFCPVLLLFVFHSNGLKPKDEIIHHIIVGPVVVRRQGDDVPVRPFGVIAVGRQGHDTLI